MWVCETDPRSSLIIVRNWLLGQRERITGHVNLDAGETRGRQQEFLWRGMLPDAAHATGTSRKPEPIRTPERIHVAVAAMGRGEGVAPDAGANR